MDLTAAPKRVGIYGGAFDPPHWAHVGIAQAAMSQLALDRLVVVPTGQAWHKSTVLSAAAHRLAMAQLAFAGLPGAVVDDREIRQPGPSFTIDTVRSLRADYPDAEFFLLMGQDQWQRFSSWKSHEELQNMLTLVIAERPIQTSDESLKSIKNLPAPVPSAPQGIGIQVLHWQAQPHSSTQVRGLAQQGLATTPGTSPMVPEAVASYISHHQLYYKTFK